MPAAHSILQAFAGDHANGARHIDVDALASDNAFGLSMSGQRRQPVGAAFLDVPRLRTKHMTATSYLCWNRNPNKFDVKDKYWVIEQTSGMSDGEPPKCASYKVTSSVDDQLNAGFDGEKFAVVDNARFTSLEQARGMAKKTRANLADGLHVQEYRAFPPPRNPRNDNHWINFHSCDIPALEGIAARPRQLLKVGTSDSEKYWETLQDEVKRGVGKSYSFCTPGTIRIDVYPGAPNKDANDKLEECLRFQFQPAGEEPDVREDPGCDLTGKAGDFLKAAKAKMK